jgi:hypothetical protein
MSNFTKQQIVDDVLAKLNDVKDGKVLREVRPFLGGTLYVVGFTDTDGGKKENYVFEKDGELRIYRFSYELYHGIAKEVEKPSAWHVVAQAIAVEGTIAICLTLTICFLAVRGTTIPEILGSALTAVLGFYFGSKVGGAKHEKT